MPIKRRAVHRAQHGHTISSWEAFSMTVPMAGGRATAASRWQQGLRVAAALTAAVTGAAMAQTTSAPQPPASRGRLLYETHCIACHTTQMHWRDNKLARDWAGLKAWVGRWQADLGLGWNEQDVVDVARHLNELYYRHPQTSDIVGSLTRSTLRD
jgi:mono/diheme cytochrome c family protein